MGKITAALLVQIVKNQKWNEVSPDELKELIGELQGKLVKKREELTSTRRKLARARNDVQRLQEIVRYQRQRIIELHV